MAMWRSDAMGETTVLSQFGAPWGEALGRLPLWRVVIAGAVAALVATMAFDKAWAKVGVSIGLFVVPLCYWAASAYRHRDSVADVMGEGPSWEQLRWAVLTAVCVFVVRTGWFFGYLLLTEPEVFSPIAAQLPVAEQTPAGLLLSASLLLCTGVLGPAAEELFFRGLLLRRLLRYFPLPLAAFCTSALFGLFHADPVGQGLAGLATVVLSLRTRSLWAPLMAHVLNNTLLLWVLTLLADRSPWWVAVPQVVCVPWLAWFLWRGLRPRPAVLAA